VLTLGVLSGTSVDAIDLALVDWSQKTPLLLARDELSWHETLRQQLLALPERPHLSLAEFGQLHSACGQAFAQAVLTFLKRYHVRSEDVTAIGSHGQTVWHQPQGEYPFSLQIGHPAVIAKQTGITTVADFRMDDIALGGQGAPLAPAFHAQLFSDAGRTVGVLNLGGIANLTLLRPNQPVIGFDTGPANTLLDAWYRLHHEGGGYDQAGAWAATAALDEDLLAQWLAHPYFAKAYPKSTGREDFSLQWLSPYQLAHYSAAVIQSTLLQLTVESVARAWESFSDTGQIWLCGGGALNTELLRRLRLRLPQCQIGLTDDLGYPIQTLEAMLFAWLAKQRIEEKPIDLASITGSNQPVILGGVWLG
jgi:anhydro-N-acetylmuramic acid kinase